jgi:hypothetical protein
MPPVLSRSAARRTQAASATDPGSTGGLLQAFGSGD